jgi:AbrB family looped-hinge helix DNA binding protein
MNKTTQLTVAQRGIVTLPKDVREEYHIVPGDQLTFIDLDGVFVLSPRRSEIDEVMNRIRGKLTAKGETLESMLMTVREEREKYGKGP